MSCYFALQLKYADVLDNWKPQPPYYMENGANFPTVVPDSVKQELIDYSFKCVKAMGFYRGACSVFALIPKPRCPTHHVPCSAATKHAFLCWPGPCNAYSPEIFALTQMPVSASLPTQAPSTWSACIRRRTAPF